MIKRFNKGILMAVMAAVILISSGTSGICASDINDAKDDLGSIQHELDEITQQLKEKQSIKDYYESLTGNIQESIDNQELQLATYNEYLEEVTTEITAIVTTIEESQKAYDEKVAVLKSRILRTYINSNLKTLDILLGASSLQEYYDNLELNSLITKHDQELVSEIKNLMVDMAEKHNTLEMLQASYTTLSETTAIVLSNMEAKAQEAATTVQMTSKTIAVLKVKEDALEAEEASLLNEIIRLQREIDYIGGQMTWPLPSDKSLPKGGCVFGWRIHPIFLVWRMHSGVDLGGGKGNNIIAANDGVVTIAQWSDSYGYYVVVDHGGGVSTLYAHSCKLLVSVGDSVKKGQVLALVGSTGWATCPHLHFEVIVNGSRVDPLLYVDPSR
ncbi:MAG: peptidoglycan DD-metalloendopeptidase family protein [Clostridia bacterium]